MKPQICWFFFFLMKHGNLFCAFIQQMLGKVSQTCKHLSFIYSEKLFVFPVRENFVPWCFNQKLQTIVFCNTFHFLLIEDWIPWANSMANTLLQSFNSVFSLLKLFQQSPGHLCGRPDQVARGGDRLGGEFSLLLQWCSCQKSPGPVFKSWNATFHSENVSFITFLLE